MVRGGINVEPSMRPWRYLGANPDSWWCMPPHCTRDPIFRINSELLLARQLGVAVVRVELPWFLIQARRDVFDWSRVDAMVSAARTHNVLLQPVLVYTPAWSASDPTSAPSASEFSAFVTAVVRRYQTSIQYWEMWNEPDLTKYWSGGVRAYVESVLIPGYDAVKAIAPEALVILGGPASANADWLNGIYDNGGGGSFDIMAFHSYARGTRALGDCRTVHEVLRAHGQESKPLWLSEYGVQERCGAGRRQQRLMTAVLTTPGPLSMAIWYNLTDDHAMVCCPPEPAVTSYWGLVRHDGRTPKNAFFTMQSLLQGQRRVYSEIAYPQTDDG